MPLLFTYNILFQVSAWSWAYCAIWKQGQAFLGLLPEWRSQHQNITNRLNAFVILSFCSTCPGLHACLKASNILHFACPWCTCYPFKAEMPGTIMALRIQATAYVMYRFLVVFATEFLYLMPLYRRWHMAQGLYIQYSCSKIISQWEELSVFAALINLYCWSSFSRTDASNVRNACLPCRDPKNL